MSLLPLIADSLVDFWRPSRYSDDQLYHLGLDDEDLLSPWIQRRLRRSLTTSPYTRALRRKPAGGADTKVSLDKSGFQVNLDVQQFSPEEVTVKATGEDEITVEAKHEEKQDEHGYISRHFVRKYKIPKGHDLAKAVSKLSSDGVLSITCPKVLPKGKTEIEIPITLTNQPSRIVDKSQNEEQNGDVAVNDDAAGDRKHQKPTRGSKK